MTIYHRQPRRGEAPKNRRGSRLGSGAPIGCVPVTRPRRDRVMGSSILASLSEAGGNDPRGLVSKPLPPHSLDPADRVERNPRPLIMQTKGPKRAVLPQLNYAEFTGVSGSSRGPSALATCRSGNRRPNEEMAPNGLRNRTSSAPQDTLAAHVQEKDYEFRAEQILAPGILRGVAPTVFVCCMALRGPLGDCGSVAHNCSC